MSDILDDVYIYNRENDQYFSIIKEIAKIEELKRLWNQSLQEAGFEVLSEGVMRELRMKSRDSVVAN